MPQQRGIKLIAENRKAHHDYYIEDRYECGIVLSGTEVKSIRNGKINLRDSYCTVKEGEMWLIGVNISPYEQGNRFNLDPMRDRRLLMHKREIRKLQAAVMQDGFALVPLSLYFKRAKVKVEVGVCKGKKLYDKRSSMAERDTKREMERVMKSQRYR
jgi:SsrA-binding protein